MTENKSQKFDEKILIVKNLRTHFFSREGILKAVDGLEFDLKSGEILGIVGESGCGKSVTAQSILRIVPKNGQTIDGKILYKLNDRYVDLVKMGEESKEIRGIRGKEISIIFQEPMTSFSPVHTIGNQITETILLHQNVTKKQARNEAISILDRVGMPNPAGSIDEYPFNLSGGMRQRAMIAMALSCRPKILIADEPTTAVDVTIQAQVLKLIREIQGELGMAVIMITHDLGVIAEIADSVLVMYLGKQIESGPVDGIFHAPRHPYTQGLLNSIPRLSRGRQEIKPIEGVVPSPYELPTGCKFHPRCPKFLLGICDVAEPDVTIVSDQHRVSCFLYQRG